MNPLNQSEKTVEKECVNYAKELRWTFRKQQGQGKRGKTDRFFMKNGVTIFVEFKRPGGKPTVKQVNEIEALRRDGFHAEWFDSIGAFKDWLNTINASLDLVSAGMLKLNADDKRSAVALLDSLYSRKS